MLQAEFDLDDISEYERLFADNYEGPGNAEGLKILYPSDYEKALLFFVTKDIIRKLSAMKDGETIKISQNVVKFIQKLNTE